MNRLQIYRVILFIAVLFVLSACGADVDQTVTFYEGGRWEADMQIVVSQSRLSFSSPGEITQQLEAWERRVSERGGTASWEVTEEEGISRYRLEANGEGLPLLNDAMFDGGANISAVVVDEERQIEFSYTVGNDFGGLGSYTLALVGDEILASNGQMLEPGKTQWIDPGGRMQASLTEKGGSNWAWLLLPMAVIGVAAGYVYWRRRPVVSADAGQVAFCRHCGNERPPGARFCPKCGKP